jgi:hypothetical protein
MCYLCKFWYILDFLYLLKQPLLFFLFFCFFHEYSRYRYHRSFISDVDCFHFVIDWLLFYDLWNRLA